MDKEKCHLFEGRVLAMSQDKSITDKINSLKARFAEYDADPEHTRFEILNKYTPQDFNASAFTVVGGKLAIYPYPNQKVTIPDEIQISLGEVIEIRPADTRKRIPK